MEKTVLPLKIIQKTILQTQYISASFYCPKSYKHNCSKPIERLQQRQWAVSESLIQRSPHTLNKLKSIASFSTSSTSTRRKNNCNLTNHFSVSPPTDIRACSTHTMAEVSFTVDHDTQNNFFFINLSNDGSSGPDLMAKLEYDWLSPSLVDMYHTEVPPQCQGKGIAKHLAKAAFDYFSEKGTTMRPTCTYLQKYLRDNPVQKYLDHVEKTFFDNI